MLERVTFTERSARRISTTVRRVEAMPTELAAPGGPGLADRDILSVGLRNDLGRLIERGECFALGTYVTGDVWQAALPDSLTDAVYIAAGNIEDGATGRGWAAGVRLVAYKERTDSYGGTVAVGMTLGPVVGQTYLTHAPFGEYEVVRIVTAPSGATAGAALVKVLQPDRSRWNTIAEAAANPKALASLNIDTVTAAGGVALSLTSDGRGRFTLGLQAG